MISLTCIECHSPFQKESLKGSPKFCQSKCIYTALRKKDPGRKRRSELKVQYGLSEADLAQMTSEQAGKCVICKESKKLYVDHCHVSGIVRGLLCMNCNTMLGHAKDKQQLLQTAIDYLNVSSETIRDLKKSKGV